MNVKTAIVLKWSGVGIVLLAVLYTLLLVSSSRALRRAYAALESDGRPMTLEEVIPAEIPDADNAARVYEAVALQLKGELSGKEDLFTALNNLAKKIVEEAPDAGVMSKFRQLAQTPVASKALSDLQEGTAKPGCRYDNDYSLGYDLILPQIGEVMRLSHILCALARMQAEDGNHAAAWDTALASLRLANAFKDDPIFIGVLVRTAQFNWSSETVQYLASLSLPPSHQLAALNNVLADFESMAPLVSGMDGERLSGGEYTFKLSAGERAKAMGPGSETHGMKARFRYALAKVMVASSPLHKRDHATYLTLMHGFAQNATAPYSAGDVAVEEEQIRNLPRYCNITRVITPNLSRHKPQVLTMIAQARVLRIGLAVLKERQEKGAFPEDLHDPIIDLPLDPFTGKPLVYLATPSGFVVYSIGQDLIDDKGTESKERGSGDIVWRYAEERTTGPVAEWRNLQSAFKKLGDDAGQPGLTPKEKTDLRKQAQAQLVELQEQEQEILRLYEVDRKQPGAARPAFAKGEDRSVVEKLRVKQLLKNADVLNQEGRFAEAVDLLEVGLAELTQPSAQSEVLHHIGLLYSRNNDPANASHFMKMALELRPNSNWSIQLSAMLLQQQQLDAALGVLAGIPLQELTDKSMLFSAHFNYACGYSMKQQVKESLTHLGLAVGYKPAITLASLSDPHLDNIRAEADFKALSKRLEQGKK